MQNRTNLQVKTFEEDFHPRSARFDTPKGGDERQKGKPSTRPFYALARRAAVRVRRRDSQSLRCPLVGRPPAADV